LLTVLYCLALQVFELVKNSLRAVHDRFDDADNDPPPIRLVVAEGEEDITIKVGGQACGLWGAGWLRCVPLLYHGQMRGGQHSMLKHGLPKYHMLTCAAALHWPPSAQVSDEGGGIPRSGLPKMWTYLYTTAKSPLEEMERTQAATEGSDGPAVLAG
jgi:hypothetical protein